MIDPRRFIVDFEPSRRPPNFAVAVAVVMLIASTTPLTAGEGRRVVHRNDFETTHVPFAEEYDLEIFGWKQHFDSLDLPHLMEAQAAVEGGPRADGRLLRLPIGGGRAYLTSMRNYSRFTPQERISDPRHLPVEPGELLTIAASFRHDDFGPGRLRVGIRFAFEADGEGRELFDRTRPGSLVELHTLLGEKIGWTRFAHEVIVPEGATGWRLELDLEATRERRPGSVEIDAIEVVASPRLVLRWHDPLRRVSAEDLEPVQIESVGLPTGDYSIDLAVIDERGEIYAAEQLVRYVDPEHPVRYLPTGAFLTSGEVGRRIGRMDEGGTAGIRFLVTVVKDSAGERVLLREVPFLTGEPPFEVGRGRSRHGVLLSEPIPDWTRAFGPYPTALVVGPRTAGWPEALRDVPEVRRSALFAAVDGGAEETARVYRHLWGAIPRWYLDPPPEDAAGLEAIAARARDLRVGVVGDGDGFPAEVPRLRTITPASAPGSGRFAARFVGESFGDDPDDWTIALFRLEAEGVSDVYITDPETSLFRASRQPGEGFEPRATLLAWQFVRGYLGAAEFLGREEWRSDLDTLLFRRDDRDGVALIARGDRFDRRPITFQVSGTPRAYDAIGRRVQLPPVEDGRLTLDWSAGGRFLLVEGIDLSLERTGRSFAVASIEGGFRLSVTNALPRIATIDPRATFPRGYRVLSNIEARALEPGESTSWDVMVELPPSAGIAGTEFLRGDLIVRRADGRTDRVPFERVLPLECARVEIALVSTTADAVSVSLTNRAGEPLRYHLYLQATPSARGERTITGEVLPAGEAREYVLPLEPISEGAKRDSASLWVGVTFTDGERGYCNRTFALPTEW